MKSNILLMLTLCCFSYAQDFWCDVELSDRDFLSDNYFEVSDSRYRIEVRIFIHILRHSDGSFGITYDQANNIHDRLNEKFSQHNIQFELVGIDEILNTDYYSDIRNPQIYYENSSSDRIDIYVAPGPTFEAPTISLAQGHYGQSGQPNPGMAISGDSFNSFPCSGNEPAFNQELYDSDVLIHEMGHCLGLEHTFSTSGGCEELIDGSNCTECGDFVCDTPAAPGINCNFVDSNTCEYTGSEAEDGTGLLYEPDIDNYMAYTFPYCYTHFTTGQKNRMHAFLLNHPNLFSVISDIYEVKTLDAGWNWVGFPVLTDNEDGIVNNNPDPVTVIFNDIENSVSYIYIEQPVSNNNHPIANWNGFDWDLSGGLFAVNSLSGYFVEMPEDLPSYSVLIDGERIAPDYPVELDVGENWISYFIPASQPPEEAFPPDVLDNMTALYSQNWFMVCRDGQLSIKSPCPDSVEGYGCYNLEYGSMVKVVMSSPVTFTWNIPGESGSSGSPYLPQISENFPIDPGKEYQPLVIENIQNGENVVEIAAVKNDQYVGAEFVNGYPVNMRVYAPDLNALSFEVVLSGGSPGRMDDAENVQQTVFIENRRMESGITFVELGRIESDENRLPETFSLVSAYPNPFNPEIEIRFTLHRDTDVELTIFNLRGRQIATLIDGRILPGSYSVVWDGKNIQGQKVSSGIYLYRLKSAHSIVQNRIMFLK